MTRALVVLAIVAGCGDNAPISGHFVVVGHSDLSGRGMNGALAVDGQFVYVGTRNDHHGIAIVDVADPSHPRVAGEIGQPYVGFAGMSTPELRVVPDKQELIVLVRSCWVAQDGCEDTFEFENGLLVFDLSGLVPQEVGLVEEGRGIGVNLPNEFYLWRDPTSPDFLLAYVSTPPGPPSMDVADLQNPDKPFSVTTYDPIQGQSGDLLASVGASDDGRTAYLAHEQGGLLLADMSEVVDGTTPALIEPITPPDQQLTWPGLGPTSVVRVPGRPLLVATDEILPPPFGAGCPWGHLRTIDVSDPTAPYIAGEFALPENDPTTCEQLPTNTAYTAHHVTATENVALVSWYAGGLEAIDISDPAHPTRLAEFRPDPVPSVEVEDPVLGGVPVEMWSYPVIQDGLIYVVDVRNGLYILRYEGWRGDEIAERRFLEGNSNLGAYMPRRSPN
jgi:hypothetical protein